MSVPYYDIGLPRASFDCHFSLGRITALFLAAWIKMRVVRCVWGGAGMY